MAKYSLLIQHIEQSNLSKKDKKELLEILKNPNKEIDLDDFVIKFLTACEIGKDLFHLFGIDK